jgi:hypothetical protein
MAPSSAGTPTNPSTSSASPFLRDFLYDPELLAHEQVDEKALPGLRGVVKISRTVINGISLINLDGFAPASQWEELSAAPVSTVPRSSTAEASR